MLPFSLPYYGVTITVPSTPAKLIDLINTAIAASVQGAVPAALGAQREIYLQADGGNQSKVILVGDSFVALSPQRCSYTLLAAQARNYRNSYYDMILSGRIYVVESTGAALLNVELMS